MAKYPISRAAKYHKYSGLHAKSPAAIIAEYSKMVKDPENAALVRAPIEPVLPVTVHKARAQFGFRYSPTVNLTSFLGAGVGGEKARLHDIVAFMPFEQSFDGGVCGKVYTPSAFAESLSQSRALNGAGDPYAVIPSGLNQNSYWTQADSGAQPTRNVMVNPRGFGKYQARVDPPYGSTNPVAFTLDQQYIPFAASIQCATASTWNSSDPTTCPRFDFWDETIITLSSPLSYPNKDLAGDPNDNSVYRPPVVTPSGSTAPYSFLCRITGLPTTERFTTVRSEHVGLPIPASWLTAVGTGFENGIFDNPNIPGNQKETAGRVFQPYHVGFNPTLVTWGADAIGFGGKWQLLIALWANQVVSQSLGFYGANDADAVTGRFINSLERKDPTVRMTASIFKVYLLGDQNNRVGEVYHASFAPHPDHQYLAPEDIISNQLTKKRPCTHVDAKNPVTLRFSMQQEKEREFWPHSGFGNASTAWGVILFIGTLGGDLNIVSVNSTIKPVLFRVMVHSVYELVDEIQGETTIRSTEVAIRATLATSGAVDHTPQTNTPVVTKEPGVTQALQASNEINGAHSAPSGAQKPAPGQSPVSAHTRSKGSKAIAWVGRQLKTGAKYALKAAPLAAGIAFPEFAGPISAAGAALNYGLGKGIGRSSRGIKSHYRPEERASAAAFHRTLMRDNPAFARAMRAR